GAQHEGVTFVAWASLPRIFKEAAQDVGARARRPSHGINMNDKFRKILFDCFFLPAIGIGVSLLLWSVASKLTYDPVTQHCDLPSPLQTWEGSRDYILKPFEKRGELDQGIGAFTLLSLSLVAKGYTLALLLGMPLGFLLGA